MNFFATFFDNWHQKRYTTFHHRGSSCQYTNIAAKIVELNSKKYCASQKLTSFLPVRTVTAPALEKNCPPLFLLERDRLLHPTPQEAAAGPAAVFPEEAKVSGRVPFS
jgi:hypothetical protein